MKNLILMLILSGSCALHSQTDTLFTRKNKVIPCKILEIGELDIKYTLEANSAGPVFVINKSAVLKYCLSTGFREAIVIDERSLENQHESIINRTKVLKIHPFSLANNQISFSYEELINPDIHLEIEAGYINSSLTSNPLIQNRTFNNDYNTNTNSGHLLTFDYHNRSVFYSGAYIKPGFKLMVGEDVSAKGLKYAHGLKGRFIRIDLALSWLNYGTIKRYQYANNSITTIATNINSFAYGGFLNYGRQFILGNILTVEYFIGIGFTAQSNFFSNPDYIKKDPAKPYLDFEADAKYISNYHGFLRSGLGLSATAGFRLGYIIPAKKHKHKN